ncbi:hypothetical protein Q3G72_007689 [Acer saccharum]|nr:hypothetical protein Q3G72_007689 [Acer saccharum]
MGLGTLLGFMNSDFHESHTALFSRSKVPSQPSMSTSGDVVTSSGVVGMIPAPFMVSSGNSSCVVMVIPSRAKSSKVLNKNLGPQVSELVTNAQTRLGQGGNRALSKKSSYVGKQLRKVGHLSSI